MRILVTGASGKLGRYLLDELESRDHTAIAWSGQATGQVSGCTLRPVSLADTDAVKVAYAEAKPDLVIHAGAESSVAECVKQPAYATKVNVGSTTLLTQLATDRKARMLFVSTDMVFDGKQGDYREDDSPSPLSAYGRSKEAAERAVAAMDQAVVRVSLLFGPALGNRRSFFDQMLAAIQSRNEITLFRDEWRTPLSFRTAARALSAAAEGGLRGVYHLGGPEKLSRFEMGQRLAAHLDLNSDRLVPIEARSVATPEPRPRDLALNANRWRSEFPDCKFPKWEEALQEMGIERGRTTTK